MVRRKPDPDQPYWIARFTHYDNHARAQLDKAIQLVGIGMTVLTALAGAAVAYGHYEILLAIPIAIVLIWAVGTRMLAEYVYLSVYKDHAEQVLADCTAGSDLSRFRIWNDFAGEKVARSLSNTVFYGTLASVSLILIVCSLVVSWINLVNLRGVVIADSILALGLLVLVALAIAANQRELVAAYSQLRAEGQLASHQQDVS
jgi:hypothetical protein